MFDVYVEGAVDPSPEATSRLAEVMSQRYGLPATDLVSRLAKGRFRVKANIDEQSATTYAKDLETIGARVTVAEARVGSTLPPPRAGVSQPPANRPQNSSQPFRAGSSLPPSNRPQTPSSRPPIGGVIPPGKYASGLAAAFHENTPIPELGALESHDSLSLSSVDGVDGADDHAVIAPVIDRGLAAAAKPAKVAKADRPKDVPVDLFAPPDAAAEQKFELAIDDSPRKRATTPPAAAPVAVGDRPSTPVLRKKSPTIQQLPIGGVVTSSAEDTPRWRFAGGVLAAVIIGFIPAHCVASIREDSAFDAIDQRVVTVESQANRSDAPVPPARIDAFRAEELEYKRGKRRSIALVSMLIWGLAGAGVGYVWFRKVPWDKVKFGRDWP